MNKQLELRKSGDFKKEYLQLKRKIQELENTLKLTSRIGNYETIYKQLVYKKDCLKALKERAKVEGIDLGD